MAAITGTVGECCANEIRHTGTATGTVITVGDLSTYVVYPPGGPAESYSKIIVYLSDIFGPFYINAQLVLDWLAEQGYLVVAPDYLEGDPVDHHFKDPDFNYGEWLQKWCTAKVNRARDIFPAWVEALKQKFGNPQTKYGVLGYCMGGPFVLEAIAQDWVTAGVTAHPVFLTEDHFRNAKKPLFIQGAAGDPWFPLDARNRAERIMIDTGLKFHFQVFWGDNHGFALRGNMDDPEERWIKEEAIRTALSWFDVYLA